MNKKQNTVANEASASTNNTNEEVVQPKELKPTYTTFVRNGIRTMTPSEIQKTKPVAKGKLTSFYYQACLTFEILGQFSKHSKENLNSVRVWLNTELKLDDTAQFVGFSSFQGKWQLQRRFDQLTFEFTKPVAKDDFLRVIQNHISSHRPVKVVKKDK